MIGQKLRISSGDTSQGTLYCDSPLSHICHICLLAISFVGGTLTIAKGTVAEICIALRSGHLRPALRQESRNRTASAQLPPAPPGGNLRETGVAGGIPKIDL
ncbi:uncharacterized protein CCOS01_06831 [Colletotrichum costaricense]|uniref:Uncharacterized protein n=1 Tax=Colletotrichum costaricense TaxID=1209916 RepID=A0AAI9Z0C3_9PEZI|nr:uncharacterized protein CCOS01_06831 [Colletotrichum costaricense]KAK1528997.1 hypothetical protein CCOS01_06831 [Colletotrichum costaricense]